MAIHIIEESALDPAALAAYGTIPIIFTVASRLAVQAVANGLGGLLLTEEPVVPPYNKDYDTLDDEGPTRWAAHFDLSRWGHLAAFDGTQRIGGAVVAWNTPGVDLLEDRADLVVLWDLRVAPDQRGHGVGARLFAATEAWARSRGCRELKVETQNTNVPACRFYARQGCELWTIRRDAYPALPDEVQLIWRKQL